MALDVLLTCNVELRPPEWIAGRGDFAEHFRRAIYGPTSDGYHGLPRLLELFDRYGLNAIFFVEGLFASEYGVEPLTEIVELIRHGGHEVQVGLQAEWVRRATKPIVSGIAYKKPPQHLGWFSRAEQSLLVQKALDHLRAAGADPSAFRAVDWGVDRESFGAIAQAGLRFDSSYNACALLRGGGFWGEPMLLEPKEIDGVHEYPVGVFEDWPGHLRAARIRECSFGELAHLLSESERLGRRACVLALESVELLERDLVHADRAADRRLARLCRFLAEHRDRFQTRHFAELEPVSAEQPAAPVVSRALDTGLRIAAQAARQMGRLVR